MSWTPVQGNQSAKGLLDAENSGVTITPGAGVAAGTPNWDGGIVPGANSDCTAFYQGHYNITVTPDTGLSNVASPNIAHE